MSIKIPSLDEWPKPDPERKKRWEAAQRKWVKYQEWAQQVGGFKDREKAERAVGDLRALCALHADGDISAEYLGDVLDCFKLLLDAGYRSVWIPPKDYDRGSVEWWREDLPLMLIDLARSYHDVLELHGQIEEALHYETSLQARKAQRDNPDPNRESLLVYPPDWSFENWPSGFFESLKDKLLIYLGELQKEKEQRTRWLQSKGGRKGAAIRGDDLQGRNERIIKSAQDLLSEGRKRHEIAGILAKRFSMSSSQIRRILKKNAQELT